MQLKDLAMTVGSKFQGNDFQKSYPMEYMIPVYHTVSDEDLPHLKHIIQYKNTQQFKDDLDVLSRDFQFVNWEEFKDFREGKFKPKKKIALLTFDDGLSEFYDIVVPILEQKGIYAINFINPEFIDNKKLMHRCKQSLIIEKSGSKLNKEIYLTKPFSAESTQEMAEKLSLNFDEYLAKVKPYMTLNQLKTLTAKGFGISNHGWDHFLYAQLNLDEQIQNTHRAFLYLKDNGFLTDSFAFPFTDFGVGQQFFDELYKIQQVYLTFGAAGLKNDSVENNLQRIPMEKGKDAGKILKEQISYYHLKKIFNKNTIYRT